MAQTENQPSNYNRLSHLTKITYPLSGRLLEAPCANSLPALGSLPRIGGHGRGREMENKGTAICSFSPGNHVSHHMQPPPQSSEVSKE